MFSIDKKWVIPTDNYTFVYSNIENVLSSFNAYVHERVKSKTSRLIGQNLEEFNTFNGEA